MFGTSGTHCEINDNLVVDMMFVLDGSGSVGNEDFAKAKEFCKSVRSAFNTPYADIQFGLIQYSYFYPNQAWTNQPYIATEISIGPHSTEDFETAMDGITLQGFQTWTAHALNMTMLEFEKSPRFNNQNIRKVMVLITDGAATDAAHLASSAEYVRAQGVKTMVGGIGEAVEEELKMIANGQNAMDGVFYEANYDALPTVLSALQSEVKDRTMEAPGFILLSRSTSWASYLSSRTSNTSTLEPTPPLCC
jgi:collagen type VI alpha